MNRSARSFCPRLADPEMCLSVCERMPGALRLKDIFNIIMWSPSEAHLDDFTHTRWEIQPHLPQD